MSTTPLHLAVALDGAGWHPAAWREPTARPAELFSARYWADQVRTAEAGLLDLVTIEDSLGLQSADFLVPDERTDQVRGRLDAVLTASAIAPLTSRIGIVPTATTTHTEPFHVSKAIATLDYASTGRAGVRVQLSPRPAEAGHFGRRPIPQLTLAELTGPTAQQWVADLFDEAADVVEVIRRLWDSWEDDAEIRDAATGRFVDRDKLHYIDFAGTTFSVRGPSIVPRPPQGQPVVAALAHITVAYRLAARAADLVFVTPHERGQIAGIQAELDTELVAAGRTPADLQTWGDLVVFLDETSARAKDRKARLDDLDGAEYSSDATIFTGTPAELADLLQDWHLGGLAGFRLRPGSVPDDLTAITGGLVPELQQRGLFRTAYSASTLRGHLGLTRPTNRYATPVRTEGTAALQGVSA